MNNIGFLSLLSVIFLAIVVCCRVNSEEIKFRYSWLVVVIFLIILFLSYPIIFDFFSYLIFRNLNMSTSDLGALGSIYGSLGTLISSIALISAFYVAYLQQDALKLMRKESFNNMFISLLELNRKIIGELNDNRSCMYFSQLSDGFTEAFRDVSEKYKMYSLDQITNEMKKDIKKELKYKLRDVVKVKDNEDSTKGFYSKFKNFKPLLKIIKDNGDISEDEKKMYF